MFDTDMRIQYILTNKKIEFKPSISKPLNISVPSIYNRFCEQKILNRKKKHETLKSN